MRGGAAVLNAWFVLLLCSTAAEGGGFFASGSFNKAGGADARALANYNGWFFDSDMRSPLIGTAYGSCVRKNWMYVGGNFRFKNAGRGGESHFLAATNRVLWTDVAYGSDTASLGHTGGFTEGVKADDYDDNNFSPDDAVFDGGGWGGGDDGYNDDDDDNDGDGGDHPVEPPVLAALSRSSSSTKSRRVQAQSSGIARWAVNGPVHATVCTQHFLYVAGAFTSAGGVPLTEYIAAWHFGLHRWVSVRPVDTGPMQVFTMIPLPNSAPNSPDDGTYPTPVICVAGNWSLSVMCYDGSFWQPMCNGFPGEEVRSLHAVVTSGGYTLYAGGVTSQAWPPVLSCSVSFDQGGSSVSVSSDLQWNALSGAQQFRQLVPADTTPVPLALDGKVTALHYKREGTSGALPGGTILIGGRFQGRGINGSITFSHVAAYHPDSDTWHNMNGGIAGDSVQVYAIRWEGLIGFRHGALTVGGDFPGYMAVWDHNGWHALHQQLNGPVYHLNHVVSPSGVLLGLAFFAVACVGLLVLCSGPCFGIALAAGNKQMLFKTYFPNKRGDRSGNTKGGTAATTPAAAAVEQHGGSSSSSGWSVALQCGVDTAAPAQALSDVWYKFFAAIWAWMFPTALLLFVSALWYASVSPSADVATSFTSEGAAGHVAQPERSFADYMFTSRQWILDRDPIYAAAFVWSATTITLVPWFVAHTSGCSLSTFRSGAVQTMLSVATPAWLFLLGLGLAVYMGLLLFYGFFILPPHNAVQRNIYLTIGILLVNQLVATLVGKATDFRGRFLGSLTLRAVTNAGTGAFLAIDPGLQVTAVLSPLFNTLVDAAKLFLLDKLLVGRGNMNSIHSKGAVVSSSSVAVDNGHEPLLQHVAAAGGAGAGDSENSDSLLLHFHPEAHCNDPTNVSTWHKLRLKVWHGATGFKVDQPVQSWTESNETLTALLPLGILLDAFFLAGYCPWMGVILAAMLYGVHRWMHVRGARGLLPKSTGILRLSYCFDMGLCASWLLIALLTPFSPGVLVSRSMTPLWSVGGTLIFLGVILVSLSIGQVVLPKSTPVIVSACLMLFLGHIVAVIMGALFARTWCSLLTLSVGTPLPITLCLMWWLYSCFCS